MTTALIDGADVAEAVCEASAAADLVVMATRGRGAWAKFWWGSVTAAVARHARSPVLLVRGRDDRPDLAGARLPRDILVPLDGTEPLPEGEPRALGDVVLCPQVIGDDWRWPLVHGLLHLLGHDHGPAMEERERAHLS